MEINWEVCWNNFVCITSAPSFLSLCDNVSHVWTPQGNSWVAWSNAVYSCCCETSESVQIGNRWMLCSSHLFRMVDQTVSIIEDFQREAFAESLRSVISVHDGLVLRGTDRVIHVRAGQWFLPRNAVSRQRSIETVQTKLVPPIFARERSLRRLSKHMWRCVSKKPSHSRCNCRFVCFQSDNYFWEGRLLIIIYLSGDKCF